MLQGRPASPQESLSLDLRFINEPGVPAPRVKTRFLENSGLATRDGAGRALLRPRANARI